MEVGDDGRPGLEGCGIEEEGKIVRGGRAGGREVMEREVCSETKSEKAQLAPTLVFAFPEKGVVPDRNVPSEQDSDHPWFVLTMRGKEAACWTERRKIIRMGCFLIKEILPAFISGRARERNVTMRAARNRNRRRRSVRQNAWSQRTHFHSLASAAGRRETRVLPAEL